MVGNTTHLLGIGSQSMNDACDVLPHRFQIFLSEARGCALNVKYKMNRQTNKGVGHNVSLMVV